MTTPLTDLSHDDLSALHEQLSSEHAELVARGVRLDITRGKPSSAQLDLNADLLTMDVPAHAEDGQDIRNYGGKRGLPEIRRIFGELLGVDVDHIIAADNSSLSIMHDLAMYAVVHGIAGEKPWFGRNVKFIAPVPGYDRHFVICEHLGIEMIPVELGEHGPNVDEVARLAADPSVKGMWVVPMYANPNGVIYDEQTVRALMSMPAAPDFRIWWDNAYALHHLTDAEPAPLPVLQWAEEAGNPDRVFELASTSKITFAGDGVSFLASSKANLDWYFDHAGIRSIGPDKVNQMRHAKYLGDAEGVRKLMGAHRAILAPKFALVDDILTNRLGGRGVATWTHPSGGYFVTLDVMDGTAARVVSLAKEAGISLTPAGASHPLGHDPHDRTIRLAPSFPGMDELREAMEGVATCVLLAAADKLLTA
ncbi:aminotransferase class I/II-fold pyridoxal phosphate-dependent enzyme [Cutibacterium equinum]|uniref:Aminotransferase class I/II-fold pyridoxal phosphate-dependent enzyme n=1 Tax=Cutibacterium equinum TaxID=3016342 RepID=A0ABY7QWY5_9ACTN|nr:aminotransferase class I/II-fold pyridoxal phosphate-dependent enzyme [Cutibacterium equinum]WCC79569.1 aminotransferase class I/II-fold pyridoxal phosphate-dependent enzyme [Cutibacterium equinum]